MPKNFTPHPWQKPMIQHLFTHHRCALWVGMGLGKTVVVLTLLDTLYMCGEQSPTLILGPLRVARSVWTDEVAKWDHLQDLTITTIVGTAQDRLRALRRDAQIYTTNYENLPWLIEYWGPHWPYKIIVADEASSIKSHRVSYRTAKRRDGKEGKGYFAGQGGKRAAMLAKIAHVHIDRFIQLTGTPCPNSLSDLWGQLWYLDKGERLGKTFDAFSQRWFKKGYDGFSIKALDHADSQIHKAVKDICLTVRSEDWFDLEKPVVNNVYVNLPQYAEKLYKNMEKEFFIELSAQSTAEAVNAAAKTSKLLQLASGAIYTVETSEDSKQRQWAHVHDAKIDALKSILAESGNATTIVCYEFKSDQERLLKAFPKGRKLSTKQDENDFKKGKIRLLFLHPKSAGHGIDGFQNVCNRIVFFGHNWSLEQYLQVIERIGPTRQMQAGLNRLVYVTHILAAGTVDELVMDRRISKRDTQDILLEACARYGKR